MNYIQERLKNRERLKFEGTSSKDLLKDALEVQILRLQRQQSQGRNLGGKAVKSAILGRSSDLAHLKSPIQSSETHNCLVNHELQPKLFCLEALNGEQNLADQVNLGSVKNSQQHTARNQDTHSPRHFTPPPPRLGHIKTQQQQQVPPAPNHRSRQHLLLYKHGDVTIEDREYLQESRQGSHQSGIKLALNNLGRCNIQLEKQVITQLLSDLQKHKSRK